jgi:uncharacterized OsmC-like protein
VGAAHPPVGGPEAERGELRVGLDGVDRGEQGGGVDAVADRGVGEERTHERSFHFDADHPAVLVGNDNGPTPVEHLLHALAACLTAGLVNIASARGVQLTEVSSDVSGNIDLNGILGLDPTVRNGYQDITVRFTVKGDAPAEKLREIVEQSRARSAVFDVLTNGVPVAIEVDVA